MTNHPETPAWVRNVKVGDKVVCVNDEDGIFHLPGFKYRGDLDGLAAGAVYTVRHIGLATDPDHRRVGDICIWLEEIIRPKGFWGEEGFDARRFRPVSKRSTDTGMSILTSILDGAPVRTGEGVS